MPQIPQYDNPDVTLNPPERGYASAETAGRRLGGLYADAGRAIGEGLAQDIKSGASYFENADDVQTHRELGQGIVKGALLADQLHDMWAEKVKNTDPADLSAAAHEFMTQTVGPAMDAYSQTFTTRRGQDWAQTHSGELQAELVRSMHADTSAAAGDAAVNTFTQTLNTRVASAMKHPELADNMLTNFGKDVNDYLSMSPTLTAQQRAKMSTELVTKGQSQIAAAAIRGRMDTDPQAGLALLNSGKYDQYLSEPQRSTLTSHSLAMQKLLEEQGRLDKTAIDKQNRETFNTEVAGIEASTIDPKSGALSIPPDYLQRVLRASNLPGASLEPGRIEGLINFSRTITEDQAKGVRAITNPNTYKDFSERAFLTQDDPNRLTEQQLMMARVGHQLSDHDYTMFHETLSGMAENPQLKQDMQQLHSFLKGYEKYIDKSTMMAGDPAGAQRFYEFSRDMTQQFMAQRAAGKPAQDILQTFPAQLPRYQVQFDPKRPGGMSIGPNGLAPSQPLPPIAPPKVQWTPGMSMEDLAKQLGGAK
jgi:hypothetical protein